MKWISLWALALLLAHDYGWIWATVFYMVAFLVMIGDE